MLDGTELEVFTQTWSQDHGHQKASRAQCKQISWKCKQKNKNELQELLECESELIDKWEFTVVVGENQEKLSRLFIGSCNQMSNQCEVLRTINWTMFQNNTIAWTWKRYTHNPDTTLWFGRIIAGGRAKAHNVARDFEEQRFLMYCSVKLSCDYSN